MTNEEDKKQNLGLGSTQPKESDEGVLRQQVLSNRQQLLSNLSANQPGAKPNISPVNSVNSPPETQTPQNQVLSQANLNALDPSTQLAMPNIVEIIFDTLKNNCIEANKSLANTDAELHCQGPQSFQERVNKSDGQTIRFLRGLISLPNYSLVVDSTDNRIVIFIVPSEFVLGFDPDSELFSPHLSITRATQSGQDGWFLGNTLIGAVMLPEISRQLLRNLIGVARGEVDPKQPFTYGSEQQANIMSGAHNAQFASQPRIQAVSPQNTNVESNPAAPLANSQLQPPPPPPKIVASPVPVSASAEINDSGVQPSVATSRSEKIKHLMKEVANKPKPSSVALLTKIIPEQSELDGGNGGDLAGGLKGLLQNSDSSSPESESATLDKQNQSRNPLKDSMEFARLSELISQENSKSPGLTGQANTLPKPPGLQQPPPDPQSNPPAQSPPRLPQPPGMQKPPSEEAKVTSTLQELAVTVNPNASLSPADSQAANQDNIVNPQIAAPPALNKLPGAAPSPQLEQNPIPPVESNNIGLPENPFRTLPGDPPQISNDSSSPASPGQEPIPAQPSAPASQLVSPAGDIDNTKGVSKPIMPQADLMNPGSQLDSNSNNNLTVPEGPANSPQDLISSGLPKPPLAQTPPVLDSATPVQADLTQSSSQPQLSNPQESKPEGNELPLKSGVFSQLSNPAEQVVSTPEEPVVKSTMPQPVTSSENKPPEMDVSNKEIPGSNSSIEASVEATASAPVNAPSLSGQLSQIAESSSNNKPQELKDDLKPTITGVSRPKKTLSSLLIPETETETVAEKPAPVSLPPGNLGQLVSETEKHLTEGCGELLDYVEKALATLKALGVEAMQNDNLDQVTEIMQHTKRLKELKDKLNELKKEVN